jgi:hypothetical protein
MYEELFRSIEGVEYSEESVNFNQEDADWRDFKVTLKSEDEEFSHTSRSLKGMHVSEDESRVLAQEGLIRILLGRMLKTI